MNTINISAEFKKNSLLGNDKIIFLAVLKQLKDTKICNEDYIIRRNKDKYFRVTLEIIESFYPQFLGNSTKKSILWDLLCTLEIGALIKIMKDVFDESYFIHITDKGLLVN